jgi:23S rRNA (adenine2503-C2)-methyltransferase
MIKNIVSYDIEDIDKIFLSSDKKKFRAKQIFEWIHKKNIENFDDMTNVSKDIRNKLKEEFVILYPKVIKVIDCNDKSKKILLSLEDKNVIECVIIKNNYGNTVCVSSQVGCRMKCAFCASGSKGLKRNLSVGEICSQVYLAKKNIENISNIVIMGTGEPLDNFDNIIKFIKIINSPYGINISQRHITLSTCGIVSKIYLLAEKELKINLAISLHATNNISRAKIMPIASKCSLDNLIKACKYYFSKTGRRISFEYILIKGINDSEQDAFRIVHLCKKFMCHINIIHLNKIYNSDFLPSSKFAENKFMKILKDSKINVTVRKSSGSNINAACGQLKINYGL